MFDDDIELANLTLKLRPIPAFPIFPFIPQNHMINAGKVFNIYAWNCATQTGNPRRPPVRYPVGPHVSFEEITEPLAALRKMKTRAKVGTFLLATGKSPSGFVAEIERAFPADYHNVDIAGLVRRYGRDHSFVVRVHIKYAFMVAKVQLKPSQRGNALFQDAAATYLLIGLPVSHKLIVDFVGTCNGARPHDDIITEKVASANEQARGLRMAYISTWLLRLLSPWGWGGMLGLSEGDLEGEAPSENGGLGEPMDYDDPDDDMLAALSDDQRLQIEETFQIGDLQELLKSSEQGPPPDKGGKK